MRIFTTWELGEEKLRELLTRPFIDEVEVTAAFQERTKAVWGEALSPQEVVARILNQVKTRGNDAVIEYAAKLDGAELTAESLWVSDAEWEEALRQVSSALMDALKTACGNIEKYHAQQKPKSWITIEPDGSILGQKVTPLDRVGIYVPGGSAPLVSTVLMCAIPARVAGVGEVVMASPVGKTGVMDPHSFGSGSPGRRGSGAESRRCPGHRGFSLRNSDHSSSGQDRRSRQYLCHIS